MRRTLPLIVGAAFGVCCGALLYSTSSPASADAARYAALLRNAHVAEEVQVDGVIYTVEDGRAYQEGQLLDEDAAALPILLRAYEKTSARRAPIAALAGVHLDRFEAAVELLARRQAELADAQTSAARRRMVADLLYPVAFLRAAAQTERARRDFLATGSDVHAKAYRASLVATLEAYTRDLSKFTRGFFANVPSQMPPFIAVRAEMRYEDMSPLLARLTRRAAEAQETLGARMHCVEGRVAFCRSEDLYPAAIPVAQADGVAPSAIAEAKERLERPPMQSLLEGALAPRQPLLALTAPECTQSTSGTDLFLLRQEVSAEAGIYAIPTLITNERLVDTESQRDTPFFNFFRAQGIRYVPYNPFVYYGCLYYYKDAADLFSIEAARNAAVAAPVSSADQGDTRTLRALEARLASATLVQEADARRYAAFAATRAREGQLSTEDANRAFELALSVGNGSAGYENHILFFAKIEGENLALRAQGLPVGLDAPYLFYARNNLSVFFMAGNPSFGKIEEPLFRTIVPLGGEPYIFYDSLSPEEKKRADQDALVYRQLHDTPSLVR